MARRPPPRRKPANPGRRPSPGSGRRPVAPAPRTAPPPPVAAPATTPPPDAVAPTDPVTADRTTDDRPVTAGPVTEDHVVTGAPTADLAADHPDTDAADDPVTDDLAADHPDTDAADAADDPDHQAAVPTAPPAAAAAPPAERPLPADSYATFWEPGLGPSGAVRRHRRGVLVSAAVLLAVAVTTVVALSRPGDPGDDAAAVGSRPALVTGTPSAGTAPTLGAAAGTSPTTSPPAATATTTETTTEPTTAPPTPSGTSVPALAGSGLGERGTTVRLTADGSVVVDRTLTWGQDAPTVVILEAEARSRAAGVPTGQAPALGRPTATLAGRPADVVEAPGRGWAVLTPDAPRPGSLTVQYRLTGVLHRDATSPAGRALAVVPLPRVEGQADAARVVTLSSGDVLNVSCPLPSGAVTLCGRRAGGRWTATVPAGGDVLLVQVDVRGGAAGSQPTG